jgi:UPF0716 protein FxsA
MNPSGILLLILLLVPVVEIYVLISVGSVIGAIPTVALVICTALLGVALLRFQGWTTMQRARLSMARGQVPALEMMSGVLLVIAGILLLTPGFVTDALGFLLLVPALREALLRRLVRNVDQTRKAPPGGGGQGPAPREPYTIEGEYRRDDD